MLDSGATSEPIKDKHIQKQSLLEIVAEMTNLTHMMPFRVLETMKPRLLQYPRSCSH